MKQLWLMVLFATTIAAQDNTIHQSNKYRDDTFQNTLALVDHLLKNDDLQCLPRLLCEYAAGGKPGQARGINIDTQSLFTLLKYLGLGESTIPGNPMFSFGKAAVLGMSNRGDSYECYKNYPRCPRDQARLLYYLNNHRGGFFQGFNGFSQIYSRILNKQTFTDQINSFDNDPDFTLSNKRPKFVDNSYETNYFFANSNRRPKYYNEDSSKLVFSSSNREQKGLPFVRPTDRLPSRFHSDPGSFHGMRFPEQLESSHFFPQY